jgi:hypothetical protein
MAVASPHNLNAPLPQARPFGIRASLKPGDPFTRLIGAEWEKFHWFATERERDAALADMAARHRYSRRGDDPAVIYEKVTQPG